MKTAQHRDSSGRIWFHRRESGDGFPTGTWVWEGKKGDVKND